MYQCFISLHNYVTLPYITLHYINRKITKMCQNCLIEAQVVEEKDCKTN